MMKKLTYILKWLPLLAVAALGACGSGDDVSAPAPADDGPQQIMLSCATAADDGYINVGTRAPVTGEQFGDTGPYFYAFTTDKTNLTQAEAYENIYGLGSTNDGQVAGNETFSHFNLNSTKYYPESGALKFYACYPAPNSSSSVTNLGFTITGQEDIMWGQIQNGHNSFTKARGGDTQEQPRFLFHHLLQQIQFRLEAGEGFPTGVYVTQISITNTPVNAVLDATASSEASALNFPNPSSTSWVNIERSWSTYQNTWNIVDNNTTNVDHQLMVYPNQKSFSLYIEVDGALQKSYNVTADLSGVDHAGEAGYSHLITLEFKLQQDEIIPYATVTKWVDRADGKTASGETWWDKNIDG